MFQVGWRLSIPARRWGGITVPSSPLKRTAYSASVWMGSDLGVVFWHHSLVLRKETILQVLFLLKTVFTPLHTGTCVSLCSFIFQNA